MACSKSLNNRSTYPGEFCVAFPAKLEGTDNFSLTYLASTKIGEICGISFCKSSGLSAEERTQKWRFASHDEYFGCMAKIPANAPNGVYRLPGEIIGKKPSPRLNGFEQYTFALLPPGGVLKAHIDDENSSSYPDLLSIGQFDTNGNRQNTLCYMRESADLSVERVKICQRLYDRFNKHARHIERYQRTSRPEEYFEHLGDSGILVIYDKDTHRTKFVAAMQRPPLDKTAYYTSAPASAILNLHNAVDLALEHVIELCVIFGLCNSVDIFCSILSQWTMEGALPKIADDNILADVFFKEVSTW